jgi:hypothetical protein
MSTSLFDTVTEAFIAQAARDRYYYRLNDPEGYTEAEASVARVLATMWRTDREVAVSWAGRYWINAYEADSRACEQFSDLTPQIVCAHLRDGLTVELTPDELELFIAAVGTAHVRH